MSLNGDGIAHQFITVVVPPEVSELTQADVERRIEGLLRCRVWVARRQDRPLGQGLVANLVQMSDHRAVLTVDTTWPAPVQALALDRALELVTDLDSDLVWETTMATSPAGQQVMHRHLGLKVAAG